MTAVKFDIIKAIISLPASQCCLLCLWCIVVWLAMWFWGVSVINEGVGSIFLFDFFTSPSFLARRRPSCSIAFAIISLPASQFCSLCAWCIVVWLPMWLFAASWINEGVDLIVLFNFLHHHFFGSRTAVEYCTKPLHPFLLPSVACSAFGVLMCGLVCVWVESVWNKEGFVFCLCTIFHIFNHCELDDMMWVRAWQPQGK